MLKESSEPRGYSRRPVWMPIRLWEEMHKSIDREILKWARGLLLASDGNVGKLTEEQVRAIAKPGEWLRRSRAARKGWRKRRRPRVARQANKDRRT
jgi:hypothetical protein